MDMTAKMQLEREKKIQVCFTVEASVVELIDYYAAKVDWSRSQMVRNLLLCGLDDAKVMNAMGVFDVVRLTNWLKRGRQQELPIGQD